MSALVLESFFTFYEINLEEFIRFLKLGVDQTSKLVNYAYLNVPSPDDELPDTGEVSHVAGGDEGGPALAVHVVDVGPGLQQVLHTVQVAGPRGCSQCCPLLSVKQVHLRGNNH